MHPFWTISIKILYSDSLLGFLKFLLFVMRIVGEKMNIGGHRDGNVLTLGCVCMLEDAEISICFFHFFNARLLHSCGYIVLANAFSNIINNSPRNLQAEPIAPR